MNNPRCSFKHAGLDVACPRPARYRVDPAGNVYRTSEGPLCHYHALLTASRLFQSREGV